MHMYMKPKNFIVGTSAKVKLPRYSFALFVHAGPASCGAVDVLKMRRIVLMAPPSIEAPNRLGAASFTSGCWGQPVGPPQRSLYAFFATYRVA
ncbi:UNVERIFIED_ORG: hypothetical protein ABIB52_004603 [Arthrobacter sp. UYCu721]